MLFFLDMFLLFVSIKIACSCILNNMLAKCLDRTLAQLEDDVAPCEAQVENWRTNLAVMASKERQYTQQYANYKVPFTCLFEL